jgi:hypothetical protein
VGRLLHRVISVLAWTTFALLAAFGLYFSFANYPALAISVAAVALLLGYVERKLRRRQREFDDARRRARARVDVP